MIDYGIVSRALQAVARICDGDIQSERFRQLKKFGVQQLPDGTGDHADVWRAGHYRDRCDEHTRDGDVTFRDVLLEEVYEALAETEYVKLRKELVEVATVSISWIADLDRRDRESFAKKIAGVL